MIYTAIHFVLPIGHRDSADDAIFNLTARFPFWLILTQSNLSETAGMTTTDPA